MCEAAKTRTSPERLLAGLVRVPEREIRLRETCQAEVMRQPLCHIQAFGLRP